MWKSNNLQQKEVFHTVPVFLSSEHSHMYCWTERQRFNADLASALTKSLQTMLTHTSSDRGRAVIPLINNATDISPFPYKIAVKVGGVELS